MKADTLRVMRYVGSSLFLAAMCLVLGVQIGLHRRPVTSAALADKGSAPAVTVTVGKDGEPTVMYGDTSTAAIVPVVRGTIQR